MQKSQGQVDEREYVTCESLPRRWLRSVRATPRILRLSEGVSPTCGVGKCLWRVERSGSESSAHGCKDGRCVFNVTKIPPK